jgi:gliding motility-associated-like protein
VTVTRYNTPGVMLAPGAPTACYGVPVPLTASGADNYSWSPSTGLSATTGATVTAMPPATTNYTLIGWNNGPLACADTLIFTFTVYPPPVISAGPNDTICFGGSTQLHGSGALVYQWSPTTGLSNPNIANPIASPAVTTNYILSAWAPQGNLIFNGTFSMGNVGFSTNYISQFNLFPEGYYYVGNNPNANHPNWTACADHTPTADNMMMIVNGAPVANQQVWCQTVNVTPNTTYAFSTWVTSVHPANPARLQFSINGVLIGAPFNATAVVCQWNQFYAVWNSGAATSATICIVNQNIIRNGNDFALDDISFSPLCLNTDTVTVYVSHPVLNISGTNVSCFNGNNGTATVTPSGGMAPYTYHWSNGGNTQSLSNLIAGTYCVTVTDLAACTSTACITLTQPTQLTSSITASTNISCFGGNNGSATVTAAGGSTPYSYLWSNGAVTTTNNNLIAGTYTVTITDSHSCTSTATVTLTEPALLTATISSSANVNCFGQNNGSATVTAAGGTTPYTYHWSNGPATPNNPNLVAGTYTVTVTDAHNCTATASVTITQPALLTSAISSSTNVSCNGGSDGTATVSANGGTPAYTFVWSNGAVTSSITNLAAGTYNVTVTDTHGCSATSSVTITQPAVLTATISASTNVSCFGGNNGSATVTAAGGTAPYGYLWSNGESTPAISNLTAGTYTVIITDNHGCTASASITITQPNLLTAAIGSSTNVSCWTGNNGAANVVVNGGTLPYSYLWSNGAVTAAISNLVAGTYSVTVTDGLNCTATTSVVITQPPLLEANIIASTNVNCFGENNGSATVTGTGGTLPYSYIWSNGANTASINNLVAGTYGVTITDNLSCTATASVTIAQPPLLTAVIGSSTNVSCFGGNNGSASVTAGGGVPPYTFLWSNSIITPSMAGLVAGTYTVTITDAHNCTASTSVTITQPTLLTSSITSSVNVSCFSGSNGTATVTAVGGTLPYGYHWSNNTSNATATGLSAGSYSVTVTDGLGCTTVSSITITEPPLLTASISASINVSCFGGNNGVATVTPAGGTAPYFYLWSNSAITPTITNLTAGTYTVTATDNLGCTATTSITITQPAVLTSSIPLSSNVSCFGGNNGSASVLGMGGTTPYSYLWNNGETTTSVSDLVAGNYTVTITDALGCTASSSVTISQPALLVANITSTTNVSCFMGSNGSATAGANGGTPPYDFVWSNGAHGATAINLASGNYVVTVTDWLGCTTTTVAVINQPTLLTASIASSVNVSCFTGNNGTATAAGAGGTTPYSYLWSSGGSSITETGLTAGTYQVTITDALGCTATSSVVITEPPLLTATITGSTNVSCFSGANGSATVSGGGGTLPYSYLWSSGGNAATENGLSAGTYTVTITDILGCTATASIVITQPTLLTSSIAASTNVSCFGGSNGTATAAANGGTPPYAFAWSSGGSAALETGLAAGTYSVTITDNLGCTSSSQIIITQPALLTASISSTTNVSCYQGSNGVATVSGAGGTLPYAYLWSSGGIAATETGLAAGTYTVTITDILGCIATANVTITEPTLLTAAIGSSTNVSCFGGNNGSATVVGGGGTPAYGYHWSSGGNAATENGLIAGNYTVTITDALGCTATTSVVITEPPLLTATITATTNVSCFSGSNGTSTVTGAGGTLPYTYLWSSGSVNATAPGLSAGTYTVTITDAHSCTATTSVTITQPTLLTIGISGSVNVSCFLGSDGSATSAAAGGTSPYTYLWSSGGSNATETGLSAGTYSVTTTDALGCTASTNIVITQPTLLTATISATVNVSCYTFADGSATVTAGGGTPAYSYHWSNGCANATATGLVAGSYDVTVTDILGCTATTSIVITEPTLLTSAISGSTNVSCFGGNNGAATVAGAGGTPPYSYLWTSGSVSNVANGLIAGTYGVTITDAHSCTSSTSVVITEPPLLTATITSSTNITCFSGNDGSATVTGGGGTLPYSYLWSSGGNAATENSLIAGTYTVTITDALACTATASVTLTQPTLLTATISSATMVSCFGFSDGAATVTGSGSVPPYTYSWSNGGNTASITNIPVGTYTVIITDAHNCTATASVTISGPTILTYGFDAVTDVTCFGGSDGAIDLAVGGGTTPYTYIWSTGAGTEDISGLPLGTYTVTVTDFNGCQAVISTPVNQPTLLTAAISSTTNVSCFGGSDGIATVSANGSVPPYTYNWSSGGTNATETGLSIGTYVVTVTDTHGCTATTSVTITQPTLLTSSIASSVNVSCFGGNNGEATVAANGGVLPYTYLWSNGSVNAHNTGLIAGNYTVTVTDHNGCTTVSSIVITEPPLLVATITGTTHVSCFGFADGAATVTGSGGTLPYIYHWSSGGSNATETGLVAGTYGVTITDALGCTASTSIVITEPTLLTSSIGGSTDVTCFGGSDGTASVIAAGGTAPYNYLWSNGNATALNSGLIIGTYGVTVTDAHGCTSSTSVVISQPTLLTATISAVTNVSCFGGNNGSATVTAAGSVPPYTYNWSSGSTNATAGGLIAGTYSVTVTDSHGCTATTSVTITQPTLLTSAITSSTDVSCFGGSDGSATVTGTGGTLPYTYLWSNGSINNFISNVISGNYTVTVTDALGCTITSSVVISQPPLLTASISSSNNISCFGGNDGSATVTAAGGTAPYNYQWSSGGSSDIEGNLTAGTYEVTVTDALGCSTTASVTLTEPTLLVSSIASSTNVLCFNGNNGSATVGANGGVAPYSYTWSTGDVTANISGLIAGTYSVTVYDNNGCSATSSVTISQPTLLTSSITASVNVSCFGGNNGSATVTPAGGVTPYTYLWSNGANTSTASNLSAGNYTVTITDNNGCSVSSGISITQPTLLTSAIASSTNISCFGLANGNATVSAAGGVSPYTYLWNNNAITPMITGLVAGTYTVTITDANGCTTTSSATLTQPALLTSVISSSVNVSCYGGSNGSADVTANGGTLPYAYAWSSGQSGSTISGLIAGSYTVTVTDSHGCTSTAYVVITQPTLLTSSISGSSNITCFGLSNGNATVLGNGGTLPYTYLWSSGGNGPQENNLAAGTYIVTVTDAMSCTSTSSITLSQPAVLVASIPTFTNISCFGGNNGIVNASGSGGTNPYSYLWSNGGNTSLQNNLVVNTYVVTITDINGCSSSASITLTQPPALTMTMSTTDVLCWGEHNGTATMNVAGGVPPYNYFWTPGGGNAPTYPHLPAGNYSGTAVDANGCQVSGPVVINQPPLLTAVVDTLKNVSCNGGSDGSAGIVASGGVPPYQYHWNTGQTTPFINNIPANTYSVVVTDANGCITKVNITITQPTPLAVMASGSVTVCNGNYTDITANASGGTAPYSYAWNNGLGNGQSHHVQVFGTVTYSVTVTDANGCTCDPSVTVLNSYPDLNVVLGGPSDVCIGETVMLNAVATGGNGGPYIYHWNNNIGAMNPPVQVQPTENTTYIVGVSDACGTPMAFDTLEVNVHEKPDPNMSADKLFDCNPFDVHFSEHTFPPFAAYYWDFGDPYAGADNNSTAASPTHFFSNSGHYTITLTVTNEFGCQTTIKYEDMIYLYGKPTAAFSYAPNPVTIEQPLVEFANESMNADTYRWSFGDATTGTANFSEDENPTHKFSEVGSYIVWLIAENKYGCIDSAFGEVSILDLYTFYAPNAFTPNGDGVNDFFIPQSTNLDYTTFEFYVYDRWGEKIYETTDPNAPWDGRAKSSRKLVQQDVYTWFIYVNEISGRRHQFVGHVTVIR